ncbi:hypothetical protein HDU76_010129, partial [Blyttiomyces sp. JEL0837]
INANEIEFLKMIDYDLFVGHRTFASWSGMIVNRTQQKKKEREIERERELKVVNGYRAGAGAVPASPLPSPPLPLPLSSVQLPVFPQQQQCQPPSTTILGIGAIPSPSTLSAGVSSSLCGSPSPIPEGILSSSSSSINNDNININATVIANGITSTAATGGLPATSLLSSSDYPSPAVSTTASVRAGLKRGFSEMSEASSCSTEAFSESEDATATSAAALAVSLVNQLCGSFDGQEFAGVERVNNNNYNNTMDLSYDAVESFLASFERSATFNGCGDGEQSIEGMLGCGDVHEGVDGDDGFKVEMERCGLLSMMGREVVKRVRVE